MNAPGARLGGDHARPVLPRGVARRILVTLAGWLGDPSGDRLASATRDWGAAVWSLAQRMITIHGLAAHIVRVTAADDLRELVPDNVRGWLIDQDRQTGRRIEAMHGELRSILAAAAAARIQVMPLKGALLTSGATTDQPHRRSMADLDVLVRPADREQMRDLLNGLGYEQRHEANPRPTHDVFGPRSGASVVSIDEHPENPRWVEVHTDVVRHLWGWTDEDELTPRLWSGATRTLVLGEEATVPDQHAVFAHLAIHASSDLLVGRGRLVQWVDLAMMARHVSEYRSLPHQRLAYPSLRLAARTQPGAFANKELAAVEASVPRS